MFVEVAGKKIIYFSKMEGISYSYVCFRVGKMNPPFQLPTPGAIPEYRRITLSENAILESTKRENENKTTGLCIV